jgi:hypothetical protein
VGNGQAGRSDRPGGLLLIRGAEAWHDRYQAERGNGHQRHAEHGNDQHHPAGREICRSRLAGERGGSAAIEGAGRLLSRTSALLQLAVPYMIVPMLCVGTIIKPDAKSVGAGLLANAVGQLPLKAQADCFRGQARSYRLRCGHERHDRSNAPRGNASPDALRQKHNVERCERRYHAEHGNDQHHQAGREICRSRLAGERGGSAAIEGAGRLLSRASALLQVAVQFMISTATTRSVGNDHHAIGPIHLLRSPRCPKFR